MKKKILFISVSLIAALLFAAFTSCAGGGTNSGESASSFENSGSKESSEKEKTSEEPKVIYEKAKNVMTAHNILDYGAKGNGLDDSGAIQSAIDACAASGGGVVYFPSGSYTLKSTLVKKAKVSLTGEGMWSTRLIWAGNPDSPMIDTSNEALWGTDIENFFFLSSGVSGVTGILGGSTLDKYNSAIGTFKNLVFSGIYCGIDGGAEPSGVGIFDCMFENVFCSSCTYGLHLYGSGNTIIHPRIATCEAGLVLDYLNGESFDGVHVIGGIFASNVTDILIPKKGGIRPTNFVGTWFENASHGILNITNTGTRIMNLTFRDCMLNSTADNKNYFLLDAKNAVGVVTLDSCTVVNDDGIKSPSDKNSVLAITNLQVYDRTGTYVYNDRVSGSFSFGATGEKTVYKIKHSLRAVPKTVILTPSTSGAAKAQYYATADATEITITFISPPTGEIGFYWELTR